MTDDRDFGNAKRDLFAAATGHPLLGMYITMLLSSIYSHLDGARTQTALIESLGSFDVVCAPG